MWQGSQNQLKEVWEEADGLDPEDFDPKTFFNLHGKTLTNQHMLKWNNQLFSHNNMLSNVRESGVYVYHCLFLYFKSDTNGDGFFDEQELEALFTKEVKPWHSHICNVVVNDFCTDCWFLQFQLEKIYDPTNEEDDMVEMEEERLRMREHVMNEVQ